LLFALGSGLKVKHGFTGGGFGDERVGFAEGHNFIGGFEAHLKSSKTGERQIRKKRS
jgi:hypothetical protein